MHFQSEGQAVIEPEQEFNRMKQVKLPEQQSRKNSLAEKRTPEELVMIQHATKVQLYHHLVEGLILARFGAPLTSIQLACYAAMLSSPSLRSLGKPKTTEATDCMEIV
uniref:Uncharacterized protein n=1 Tax=Anopheles merus TaxID=30066 RepID=A0A182V4B2_ANOME